MLASNNLANIATVQHVIKQHQHSTSFQQTRRYTKQPNNHWMPSGLENVPEGVLSHNTPFLGILERERRERSGNKQGLKMESKLPAGWSQVKSIYLNVFWGISLGKLDAFHYFQMWGTQICWENILFRTKRPSFWCFKISVHLGLKEQIFTRFCFNYPEGCGFPNQA